jgi:tRNA nucleotidyltransferase (CCA-adding enzyme)
LNLESVLKRIVPTKEEEAELREVVSDLLGSAQREADRLGVDAEPFLTGSVAKNTHLKNAEIDIFLGFSSDTSRKDLEVNGLRIGESILKGRRMYAEHPYTHGVHRGHEVDIVPCYRLESAAGRLTAVDRTPFHAKYVIGKLTKGQDNEVRLFKQFSKGVGIYGAEAKVQGLSGYLCELLVLKYGTFEGLVESVSSWQDRPRVELDVKAKKKFSEPLVVIDPVDPKRNVASAVSATQLARLIHACREYAKSPSERFFFPEKLVTRAKTDLWSEMETRGSHFVCLETGMPDITDDVLYPQLRKMEKVVVELCESEGFLVLDSMYDVVGDKIILLLELEVWRLPLAKKHAGPPITNDNSSKFLEKWTDSPKALSSPFVEGKRWMVFVRREHETVRELLEGKTLTLSLGKDIRREAKKGLKVSEGKGVLTKGRLRTVTAMLDKMFPWGR